MSDRGASWRRIHEDGVEWEARVVSEPRQATEPAGAAGSDLLEFVCVDGSRSTRRLAVPAGALDAMDEMALRRAYRQARTIGGDHYGRPGKRMSDGV